MVEFFLPHRLVGIAQQIGTRRCTDCYDIFGCNIPIAVPVPTSVPATAAVASEGYRLLFFFDGHSVFSPFLLRIIFVCFSCSQWSHRKSFCSPHEKAEAWLDCDLTVVDEGA